MSDFAAGFIIGNAASSGCNDYLAIELAKCQALEFEQKRIACIKQVEKQNEFNLETIEGVLIVTFLAIAFLFVSLLMIKEWILPKL